MDEYHQWRERILAIADVCPAITIDLQGSNWVSATKSVNHQPIGSIDHYVRQLRMRILTTEFDPRQPASVQKQVTATRDNCAGYLTLPQYAAIYDPPVPPCKACLAISRDTLHLVCCVPNTLQFPNSIQRIQPIGTYASLHITSRHSLQLLPACMTGIMLTISVIAQTTLPTYRLLFDRALTLTIRVG